MLYIETSARDNINVANAFELLAQRVYKQSERWATGDAFLPPTSWLDAQGIKGGKASEW